MSLAKILSAFDYPLECAREWNNNRHGRYEDCFAVWRVFNEGERTALESADADKFLDTREFSQFLHIDYTGPLQDWKYCFVEGDWFLVAKHQCGTYITMIGGCGYTGFGYGLGLIEINVSDDLATLAHQALDKQERSDLAEALQRKKLLDECLGIYLAEVVRLHMYELKLFHNKKG